MEHNRGSKFQSVISVQSRRSNLSHPRSLGRPSFQLGDLNMQHKASLVYAMSIQSEQRKSDIFQRLLQSQKKSSQRPSSIKNSQTNQYTHNQNHYYQNQRNSDIGVSNKIQIDHDCGCFDNCLQNQCACFQAKNQMCVKGTCCNRCVQLKTLLLRNNTLSVPQGSFYPYTNQTHHQNLFSAPVHNQNNIQQIQATEAFSCNCKNTECLKSYCKCFQNLQFCSDKCGCESCKNKHHSQQRYAALQAIKTFELTYCTCKKTKCNKKYCSCYASGIKCGKHCSCENCTNCDHNNDMDIEMYEGQEEQDFKNAQMPQRMSFQPVNFE